MKKAILTMLSLLVVSLLLVGCVEKEEVSEEELNAELEQLSDQELDQIINELKSKDTLAGEAVGTRYVGGKKVIVSPRNLLRIARKVKLNRLMPVEEYPVYSEPKQPVDVVGFLEEATYCKLEKFEECLASKDKYACVRWCFNQPFDDEVKLSEKKFIVIIPKGWEENIGKYKLDILKNCYPKVVDYLGIEPEIRNNFITNRFIYSQGMYRSRAGMHGIKSLYDNSSIWNYLNQVNDQNIGLCNDVLIHELTHLAVFNTPLPGSLNEGLATYIIYKSSDIIECQENGYAYDGEIFPYVDLAKSIQRGKVHDYYRTGYCFWEFIENDFGHDKLVKIMQELDGFRDQYGFTGWSSGWFTSCTDIAKSVYFIENVTTPALGVDISEITEKRFGFGKKYSICS